MKKKLQDGVKPHPWIKKKSTKIAIIIVAVLLALLTIVGSAVYLFAKGKVDKLDQVEIDTSSLGVSENEVLTGYRNIAILGLDTRGDSYGTGNRSDNMIIASINNDTNEVKLISVYRDSYLRIEGHGLDKATHAYSYGAAQATLKMLNENLDLNITEFVTVNFESVIEAVDAVGGVSIPITSEEVYHMNGYIKELNSLFGKSSKQITVAGTHTLDGVQALAYARIRYTAGGDYKRTERIRDVLTAIVDKLKTKSLLEINSFIDKMLPMISTNLKMSDFVSMIPVLTSFNITESIGWPYDKFTKTINGISYVIPDTLEEGVRRLHVEAFGDTDYVVPDNVKEISQAIIASAGSTYRPPVSSSSSKTEESSKPLEDTSSKTSDN